MSLPPAARSARRAGTLRARRAGWLGLPLGLLLACAGDSPVPAPAPAVAPAARAAQARPVANATSLAAATAAAPAASESAPASAPDGQPAGEPAAAPPAVGLDSLLKLPAGRTYTVERRGGLSSGEWKARFAKAREAIKDAEAELLATEAKLEESAESSAAWQVAPPLPGQQASNPNENTVDFQLRQELKRHRDEIERLERRLRDVEVEANLHGVPEEWRAETALR